MKIMKCVTLTAFGLLLLGGFNFLMMGLFNFDLFASIFGGADSVTSRVFYSLFGISALTLLGIVIWKAFMGKKVPVVKVTTKTTNNA